MFLQSVIPLQLLKLIELNTQNQIALQVAKLSQRYSKRSWQNLIHDLRAFLVLLLYAHVFAYKK